MKCPSCNTSIKIALALMLILATNLTFAVPPTAVDDVRSMAINSVITINLLANDFDLDGDSFSIDTVGEAANGEVEVNQDGSIIYTPDRGYSGVESFTYTIVESTEGGETGTATVTITVVTSELGQVLGAADYIAGVGESFGVYCDGLRQLNDTELGAVLRNMLERCSSLEALANNNPELAAQIVGQIAPEEALSQMRSTLDTGRVQSGVVSQRMSQVRSGGGSSSITLNGLTFAAPNKLWGLGGGDTLWAALSVFATVQIDQTERERSEQENGYDSDGNNLTFGADYRINDHTLAGLAIGLNNSDVEYKRNSGSMTSDLNTYILFGSWSRDAFVLEGQIGFGDLRFDSQRHINYYDGVNQVNETSLGSTSGDQFILNTQLQWEWHRNALTLYPFVRVDSLNSEIDSYQETGSAGYAMTIGSQKVSQLTLSTGLQASYVYNNNWGVLIPTARLALLSEVHSDRDSVSGNFAFDPNGGNAFNLDSDGGDKNFAMINVGASTVLKRGLSTFVQYQHLVAYKKLTSWQLQAGFRYEL